jgi:predicted ATPase
MRLMREHATPTFLAFAITIHGWARARLGERDSGVVELNEGLADSIRQGNRIFLPLFWGLLAEIEADDHGAEGALRRVDEALALAAETGEHWTDSLLHRIRGEILLKHDPANNGLAPSRNTRTQRASNCAQRCRWPGFTNQVAARSRRMRCLRRRSKVFRQRRNFPRSPKPKNSSPRCRCEPIKGGSEVRVWHVADVKKYPIEVSS